LGHGDDVVAFEYLVVGLWVFFVQMLLLQTLIFEVGIVLSELPEIFFHLYFFD
jgi:hypothetical protein